MIDTKTIIEMLEIGKYSTIIEGHFNKDLIVDIGNSKYIIKIPKLEVNDYRDIIINESNLLNEIVSIENLNIVKESVTLKYKCKTLTILPYIEGTSLDNIYGEFYDKSLPSTIAKSIAKQMAALHSNPISKSLIKYHRNIDADFYNQPFLESSRYYQDKRYNKDIFTLFNVPTDIDTLVKNKTLQLKEIPFTLCHNDIHRANIIQSDNGNLYIIDWGMVSYSDPCKDIALHLQKINHGNMMLEEQFLRTYYDLNPIFNKYEDFKGQIYCFYAIKSAESLTRHLYKLTTQYKTLQSDTSESVRCMLKLQQKILNFNFLYNTNIVDSFSGIQDRLETIKSQPM